MRYLPKQNRQRSWRLCAIVALYAIATPTLYAEALATPQGSHDKAAIQAMLNMQYADEQRCFIINGDAVAPVLPLLVSSDGLKGVVHENVVAALDEALARGCDINQPDVQGLSPLNTALLQRNTALTRYLLDHGADPARKIESTREILNGLDSMALLTRLQDKAPEYAETWRQLHDMLAANIAAQGSANGN